LIILQPGEVDPAGTASLSDHRADHALTVLKVTAGDEIRVGRLDGPLGIAVVHSIEGGTLVLRCRFEPAIAPRPPVDLLLALPRPKVMRRLWAQIAALGVGRIILTHASKVERHYFDTHWLEPHTFQPLLIEGLQQAKDTRMPQVSIHKRLKVLVEDELDALVGDSARILADPSAGRSPGAIIRAQAHRRLLLAVGPEGGWNEFERDLFDAHGFQAIGLGSRTLRTDTACVALLAVVHAALADVNRGVA
jgi:16S rRNA (uracil1498-N3)-methyltransferase